MGANPNRKNTNAARPLTRREIETAQVATKSGAAAARYLNVNYLTYKKYATLYDIFDHHRNKAGRGVCRVHLNGAYGLKSILDGEHPLYNHDKLKLRLIAAGYLKDECDFCGYNTRRVVDGRVPLNLVCKDGDDHNLHLDNLHLLCYNCQFQTSGRVNPTDPKVNPAVETMDLFESEQLTQEDIDAIQEELMQENIE